MVLQQYIAQGQQGAPAMGTVDTRVVDLAGIVVAGGTIQVNTEIGGVTMSGTLDVRNLTTSTVITNPSSTVQAVISSTIPISASTLDVRVLNSSTITINPSSTVQILAGTLDVRTLLTSTVQLSVDNSSGTMIGVKGDVSGRLLLSPSSTTILNASSTVIVVQSGTYDVRSISTSTVQAVISPSSTVQSVTTFSGTMDVRAVSSSTVQIQAGTLDVRTISTSTVQVQAGTIDIRSLSTSTVQIVAGTIDVRTLGSSTIQISGGTITNVPIASSSADTATLLTVGTVAGTILAANVNRMYANVRLLAGGTLTLRVGAVPTSLNGLVFLSVGDIYEITADNLNTTNLQAINTAVSSTVSVEEQVR